MYILFSLRQGHSSFLIQAWAVRAEKPNLAAGYVGQTRETDLIEMPCLDLQPGERPCLKGIASRLSQSPIRQTWQMVMKVAAAILGGGDLCMAYKTPGLSFVARLLS